MEVKHIICISGGKDSTASAILAIKHGEPLDLAVYCEVMFDQETSGEVPEHRDFMYGKVIPWLKDNGIEVYVVRGGKTFLDCFYQQIRKSKDKAKNGKFWGFPIGGHCYVNRDCKIRPMYRFFKENGLEDTTQYVGIAIDEPERLARLDGVKKVSLLSKYGYTEAMAAELCKEYGLYSPAYEYSNRNGCWFCPNCKICEFAEFKRRHPDRWQRLLDLGKAENLVSYKFRYNMTIEDVDREISMQAAQMRLWDLEECL